MSKYYVLQNLKRDGKRYSRGDEVGIEDSATAGTLVAQGVIAADKPAEAPVEDNSRTQAPEEKAAARAGKKSNSPEETSSVDPGLVEPTDTPEDTPEETSKGRGKKK